MRANDLQFRGTALSGPRFQHKTTSGLAPPSPKRYQNETHTTKPPKCVGQDTVLNIRVKASYLKASFYLCHRLYVKHDNRRLAPQPST